MDGTHRILTDIEIYVKKTKYFPNKSKFDARFTQRSQNILIWMMCDVSSGSINITAQIGMISFNGGRVDILLLMWLNEFNIFNDLAGAFFDVINSFLDSDQLVVYLNVVNYFGVQLTPWSVWLQLQSHTNGTISLNHVWIDCSWGEPYSLATHFFACQRCIVYRIFNFEPNL